MKVLDLKKILIVLILFSFVLSFMPVKSSARTLEEIQSDIEKKEQELEKLNQELSGLEGNLKNEGNALENIQGEIPKIQAELDQIEKSIEINKLKLTDLALQQELKTLEFEEAEIKQTELVRLSYLGWKTGMDFSVDLLDSTKVKNEVYQTIIISDGHGSLEELVEYILGIEDKMHNLEEEVGSLDKRNVELEQKKAELKNKENQIIAEMTELSQRVLGAKSRKGTVKSDLDGFYAEQQAILDYEEDILDQGGGSSGNGTNENDDNTGNDQDEGDNSNSDPQPTPVQRIYFAGQGRDLYQGHGVGMSQFGALGAALNGKNYQEILKHYYQGVNVTKYQENKMVKVDGYGTMSIEDYVAGIAEVPTIACEDVGVKFDSNNIWKCWPKEAIKAQAVAARTYAISRTQNGGSICTSTACQVYDGSKRMKWAAEATAGEVILYQGKPIEAVYSSDNNQGWGTTNNDTVWSNYAGDGTPKPYLRASNDNAFAYKTSWGKFKWNTNNYTYADIDKMLNFVNEDSNLSSSRTFINGLRSEIGNITGISFTKDPSGRVAKVQLKGSTGKTKAMAGWLFKSIWNSWVYKKKPSGQLDYIYSLTFSSYNKQ